MSLKYGILGLISIKPLSGYDLKRVFDNSLNFFWSAKQSQIYRELTRLSDEGYVIYEVEHQEGRPEKKIYRITPSGEQALKNWLNTFPDLVSTSGKDEFLLRIYFGSKISKDELIFQFRKYIKERESSLEALRLFYNNLKKTVGDPDCEQEKFFRLMTIRKGLMIYDASIKWALECIDSLYSICD